MASGRFMRDFVVFRGQVLTVSALVLLGACGGKTDSTKISPANLGSPQQLADNSLRVTVNFNPAAGTADQGAVGQAEANHCYQAGTIAAATGDSLAVNDEIRPWFENALTTNIIPGPDMKPMSYSFSVRYSDQGCGARGLEALCEFYNATADGERTTSGVKAEDFAVPARYVYSTGVPCMVNNASPSNSYAEYLKHAIAAARIGDVIHFSIWLRDGAGNWSRNGIRTQFMIFDKLSGPVTNQSIVPPR